MRRMMQVALAALAAAVICGCSTVNVSKLQLGMECDQVKEAIGKPTAIRAAKVYADEETAEVWEYLPPMFTWEPKTYWVYFENGKVVQWGEPGDFSGSTASAVKEYNPVKSSR